MVHVKECPNGLGRSTPVTEFYKNGEPQIYCMGWTYYDSKEPMEECRKCADWVWGIQCEMDLPIEILTKMLGCENIDSCNCDCFRCGLSTKAIERRNALEMAIKSLEKEKRRCCNCTNEQHCKVTQRLGAYGFCSEWEGEIS